MNNEEQIKVLQMVADGVITVEEGEKLLDILESAAESELSASVTSDDFMNDFKNDVKQSKLDKKRDKEYKKHLKRMQKAEKKYTNRVSTDDRIGEDRFTKAVDELAQKAVDKAFESIGIKVEDISNSIFD